MSNKFKNYTESIQSEEVAWPSFLVSQSKNYNELLSYHKEAAVLEFGPGRGYFTDWMLCNGYENITLVEFDEANCEFLKEKYSNFENISIIYEEMANYLKETSHTYDIIISKQVLEHIPTESISDVFTDGYSNLRSGGVMIHETINATNVVFGTYYRYIDFSHTIAFTEKSLREFSGMPLVFSNYRSPSVFALLKSKLNRTEVKSLMELKNRLILKKIQTQEINREQSSSKNYLVIFLSHAARNVRVALSRFLTRILIGKVSSVTTPFIVAKVYKD